MKSRSDDVALLLSQVRTAAEARWPGCEVEACCHAFHPRDLLAMVRARAPRTLGLRGPRGEEFAWGETETEALERLLAEVRR